MKSVHIFSHDFEKTNLFGNKDHSDNYKCRSCGAKGKRPTFQDIVMFTEAEAKIASRCQWKAPDKKSELPDFVEVLSDQPQIGIMRGRHKVVACPAEYSEYINDVWVYSESRKEPVRLLTNEYKHA